MEAQIRMVTAASEVFNYHKKNPMSIDEDVFQYISNHIEKQGIRDEKVKRGMIAAASKAFELSRKNPNLPEKALLKNFMPEIPIILASLEED